MTATAAAHPYVPDGLADHKGRDRCADCGLGYDWGAGKTRHDLAAVPDEAKELEDRMLGEATAR